MISVHVLRNPKAMVTGKELSVFMGKEIRGAIVTRGYMPPANHSYRHSSNGRMMESYWLVGDINKCYFW